MASPAELGTANRYSERRTLVCAGALAFLLVAWLVSRQPAATRPGDPVEEARAGTAASRGEHPAPGAAPMPAAQRWPQLKAGLELLERNRHAAAEAFFRGQAERHDLPADESAMALYFQAEALFALDRLAAAAPLYRRFVERHPEMPPADNARSALEYIAKGAEYRKALGRAAP